MRVWIDGVLLIDEWRDQAPTTITASRALTAGRHDVRVEWFETGYGAVAKLDWTAGGAAPGCAAWQYRAEYFPNKTLTGTPTVAGCEAAPLNHRWGTGSPAGVGPDNFSARWTGSFDFATAGPYTFTAVSDDGIRVWVDEVLIVDQWKDQSATYTATREMTAGRHDIKVEWFETGGDAVAKLSWAAGGAPGTGGGGTGCALGQHRAEYFANRTLSGTPVRSGCEAAPLNYNWGSRTPDIGARWAADFA